MITALLRTLLRYMPASLADRVYSRLLRGHVQRLPGAFAAAPLRLCPSLSMNLSLFDTAHGRLALVGVYEPELSVLFERLSKGGGLLLDVGANFGYFSLLWCGLNSKNRSIAFEASPKVLPKLRDNLALNHLSERIDLRELAVSNAVGVLSFDMGPPDQTGWGGISKSSDGDSVVQVASTRLDEIVEAPEIALLKIDCEGADALVLEGAEALLSAGRIKHVVFEENLPRQQALGINEGQAIRLLEKFGYSCRRLDRDPWIKSYHAERV